MLACVVYSTTLSLFTSIPQATPSQPASERASGVVASVSAACPSWMQHGHGRVVVSTPLLLHHQAHQLQQVPNLHLRLHSALQATRAIIIAPPQQPHVHHRLPHPHQAVAASFQLQPRNNKLQHANIHPKAMLSSLPTHQWNLSNLPLLSFHVEEQVNLLLVLL